MKKIKYLIIFGLPIAELTRFYRKDGSMFDWHLFIHLFGGINIRWAPGLGLDYVRKYPERHYWIGPRFQ